MLTVIAARIVHSSGGQGQAESPSGRIIAVTDAPVDESPVVWRSAHGQSFGDVVTVLSIA